MSSCMHIYNYGADIERHKDTVRQTDAVTIRIDKVINSHDTHKSLIEYGVGSKQFLLVSSELYSLQKETKHNKRIRTQWLTKG